MKKSVMILGFALCACSTVATATTTSNFKIATPQERNYFINPLNMAISKGDIEAVKKFIYYGANVNEKSNDMYPLMVAARFNRVEVIELLLANGAKFYSKNEAGLTALRYAEISNAKEAIEILKKLK